MDPIRTALPVARAGRYLRALILAACCVLVMAGCESGTLTNSQQSCQSSGGLFADKKISCTGSVGTVKGSPRLSIADLDEEFGGPYKLDATITVEKGTLRAIVTNADGEEAGGEVTPEEPLQISETVELSETDEELELSLEVSGEQIENLRYEARLTPQG